MVLSSVTASSLSSGMDSVGQGIKSLRIPRGPRAGQLLVLIHMGWNS